MYGILADLLAKDQNLKHFSDLFENISSRNNLLLISSLGVVP